MLTLSKLSLRRGTQLLLEEADARITQGQRVAIVGANGAGKTSLFKLILGEISTDAGDLDLVGQCRISHMAQEVDASLRSAVDYVLDGHKVLRSWQEKLAAAESSQDDSAMALAHAELDGIRAFELPSQAEKLLHGLGFKQGDIQRPVADFSGGWRIRLNLAQALLCPSDLLLLDEPTNHLDLDAMLWLEQWLKQYTGTLIFISHDRDFIDAVSTQIMHVEHQKLNQYPGSYSDFEKQRSEKLALQQSAYEKQQQRIEHVESFIRRFKAKATKAKQAQSRVKELERMTRIAPAHVDSPFSFEFPNADKTSSPLLAMQETSLGYDNSPILKNYTESLLPDMRIGLLGPNGAGKSTLVKSLVGALPLLTGDRIEGEHLSVGYFAQHQVESLDLDGNPLLHIQRISPTESEQRIRDFLGGFDFRGDKALEKVNTFSGGEKARLALAMIAWQKPNLLLLDEPTNHLDLEMREALTLALQTFEGAVVIVSHDRHLLKNTVDTFWLVNGGKVEEFKGDLHDYEQWLKDYTKAQVQLANPSEKSKDTALGESAEDKRQRKRDEAAKRAKLSPLKNKLTKTEKQLDQAQIAFSDAEASLANADLYLPENKDKLLPLLEKQNAAKQQIEELEMLWFEINEEIEALEA